MQEQFVNKMKTKSKIIPKMGNLAGRKINKCDTIIQNNSKIEQNRHAPTPSAYLGDLRIIGKKREKKSKKNERAYCKISIILV